MAFLLEYFKTDGAVVRISFRSDGNKREGLLSTESFLIAIFRHICYTVPIKTKHTFLYALWFPLGNQIPLYTNWRKDIVGLLGNRYNIGISR